MTPCPVLLVLERQVSELGVLRRVKPVSETPL